MAPRLCSFRPYARALRQMAGMGITAKIAEDTHERIPASIYSRPDKCAGKSASGHEHTHGGHARARLSRVCERPPDRSQESLSDEGRAHLRLSVVGHRGLGERDLEHAQSRGPRPNVALWPVLAFVGGYGR